MATVDLAPERVARMLSGRRFTVFFSGGKDSLAALLWVLDNVPDTSNMRVIYAEVTGNTHPLCNEYARKVAETLGLGDRFYHVRREDRDFFSDLVRIGPPLLKPYRWCLTEFKRKAWRPHAHGLFAVAGIRAEESPYRAKWPFLKKNCDGQFVLSPIFTWSREEVLDFIREHGFLSLIHI